MKIKAPNLCQISEALQALQLSSLCTDVTEDMGLLLLFLHTGRAESYEIPWQLESKQAFALSQGWLRVSIPVTIHLGTSLPFDAMVHSCIQVFRRDGVLSLNDPAAQEPSQAAPWGGSEATNKQPTHGHSKTCILRFHIHFPRLCIWRLGRVCASPWTGKCSSVLLPRCTEQGPYGLKSPGKGSAVLAE